MEQGIFVSYRRQDSQSAAGRLTDHLKEHLPGVPIFRDVETIEPGVDFVDAIDRALRACRVLIAVIGPRWVDAAHADGSRRLDDPNDYTRLEIATALRRKDVRVIPVLVEGADMPTTAQLPDDLEPLARRNAIELADKRWDFDVSQLVDSLRKTLDLPEPVPPAPAPDVVPPASAPASRRKWLIGAALAFVVVIAALVEEGSGYDPMVIDVPGNVSMPGAGSPPAVDGSGADVPVSSAVAPAMPVNLTGMWRDVEGGVHEVYQQGNQLQFRGQVPDGFVSGTGVINGRQGETTYLYNGYTLQSRFTVSEDGGRMDVIIIDPATNQREVTQLFRIQ